MQGVKTQSSGSNYIVSGTVVVTNVGTSNTAVSTVQVGGGLHATSRCFTC
jgi:hypothetical protein